MGIYINRGNSSFRSARRSDYVDKSALISFINGTINTENRFTCVSRARRFGKSMAARMLYAYYDKSSDSRKLFEDLLVADPAIRQVKERRYPEKLAQFADNLLLVGINYDKKTKKHACRIEHYEPSTDDSKHKN